MEEDGDRDEGGEGGVKRRRLVGGRDDGWTRGRDGGKRRGGEAEEGKRHSEGGQRSNKKRVHFKKNKERQNKCKKASDVQQHLRPSVTFRNNVVVLKGKD